jgi:pimeloyl-ACP methyl ester carboxylesterase
VILLHGGPGAIGSLEPLARELSEDFGVIEHLQSKKSIEKEMNELNNIIERNADVPVTIIGHSYGAWFATLFADKYPLDIRKLILVSSGPFKNENAKNIMDTRFERLSEEERENARNYMDIIFNKKEGDKKEALTKFGTLMTKTDSYELIEEKPKTKVDFDLFDTLSKEISDLRYDEKLLDSLEKVEIPIVFIQGNYDPHPADKLKETVEKHGNNTKFYLLKKCGHYPWLEKYAKDDFITILDKEL